MSPDPDKIKAPPMGCLVYTTIAVSVWVPVLALACSGEPVLTILFLALLGLSAFGSGYHLGRWRQREHPGES